MSTAVTIELATGSPAEQRIRDDLMQMLTRYDLGRWQFTDTIAVEEGSIPRSHPVLTLSTINTGPFLLSSYLHEQLHWYTFTVEEAVTAVHDVLCDRYPDVPVGDREGGPGGALSTRLHIIVCWLEWDGLRQLIGADRARKVIEQTGAHHYTWVYRTVLDDDDELGRLFASYGISV